MEPIKTYDSELEKFVEKNKGTGLAIKVRGRWGTMHWEIKGQRKGDYQLKENIDANSEDDALKEYFENIFPNFLFHKKK